MILIPLVQTDPTPLEGLVHQYPPDKQRLKFQWKCKDHRKELKSGSVVKSVLTGCPLGPGSPCFPGNPIPPIAPLLPDAPIGPGRPFSPWRTKHIQLIFTVYPFINRHCWSRQAALTLLLQMDTVFPKVSFSLHHKGANLNAWNVSQVQKNPFYSFMTDSPNIINYYICPWVWAVSKGCLIPQILE